LIKDSKKESVFLRSVVSHSGKTHRSVRTGRSPVISQILFYKIKIVRSVFGMYRGKVITTE
jgi:hypothetical protein